MKELELKYGCNPNQKPSRIFMKEGELPIEVLNGKPGYINFCDAFNSWQLVKEMKEATGYPSAASFKHVSPAGAAIGLPLSDVEKQIYFVEQDDLSPIACAYIRARGADRLCSYGDWAALSDVCDAATATYLKAEVSDGIIAPGYTDEALEILKTKRRGTFNVVKVDPNYEPAPIEYRDIFGVTFQQGHNNFKIRSTRSPTRSAMSRTVRQSASARVSRAASTAPVWRAARRTTGACVSIRRFSVCSLSTTSAVRTATMRLISISPTSTRTYWQRAYGSRPSRSSRRF